ncbi:hypothetical protein [Methylobacillus flagellatus]|uniref:hypothetical protein n=1 Tax=Methylobacillus flagellatus TaxID=405 RepID=UPI0010F4468E|nr:hypothetical protein [Methylobacillus flagellatus]
MQAKQAKQPKINAATTAAPSPPGAAVQGAAPDAPSVAPVTGDHGKVKDPHWGQGGSYVVDPSTGQRVRRPD